uniref:Uncharacterized protein n=1 Tax=Cannabis sativa TaxID=3483 RepID=A0A803QDM6_CANSA
MVGPSNPSNPTPHGVPTTSFLTFVFNDSLSNSNMESAGPRPSSKLSFPLLSAKTSETPCPIFPFSSFNLSIFELQRSKFGPSNKTCRALDEEDGESGESENDFEVSVGPYPRYEDNIHKELRHKRAGRGTC